jgi:hypothetical protein
VSKPAAKLSVSVPAALAKSVRKRVGARGLSSFVARAMNHELEREQVGELLQELDTELGQVPKKALAQAKAAWRKR